MATAGGGSERDRMLRGRGGGLWLRSPPERVAQRTLAATECAPQRVGTAAYGGAGGPWGGPAAVGVADRARRRCAVGRGRPGSLRGVATGGPGQLDPPRMAPPAPAELATRSHGRIRASAGAGPGGRLRL